MRNMSLQQISEKLIEHDNQFARIDQRFLDIDKRFDRLEAKFDQGFAEMKDLYLRHYDATYRRLEDGETEMTASNETFDRHERRLDKHDTLLKVNTSDI